MTPTIPPTVSAGGSQSKAASNRGVSPDIFVENKTTQIEGRSPDIFLIDDLKNPVVGHCGD
jgi:hypothetical protein